MCLICPVLGLYGQKMINVSSPVHTALKPIILCLECDTELAPQEVPEVFIQLAVLSEELDYPLGANW